MTKRRLVPVEGEDRPRKVTWSDMLTDSVVEAIIRADRARTRQALLDQAVRNVARRHGGYVVTQNNHDQIYKALNGGKHAPEWANVIRDEFRELSQGRLEAESRAT